MRYAAALLALLSLTGCATRIPFTHQLRTRHGLGDEQLENIQFYTSGTLTLRRHVEKRNVAITPRRGLRLTQDKGVLTVVIPAGTPGVVVNATSNSLAVSFEPGRSVVFGSTEANREKLGGRYMVLAETWEPEGGLLTYGGQPYRAVRGSGDTHLLVDAELFRRNRLLRRKVAGRRIGGMTVER